MSNTTAVKRGCRKFVAITLMVSGLVLTIPGVWMLLATDHYSATARVELNQNLDLRFYDPGSLNNTFEMLQSAGVLTNALNDYRVDSEWRKRFATGDVADAVARLKSHIHLTSVSNTAFVDIRVISRKFLAAENTANAVADAFCDWRPWRLPPGGLGKILEQDRETAEEHVEAAQAEVDRLKTELNLSGGTTEGPDSKRQAYQEAEQRLELAKKFRNLVVMRLSTSWLPEPPVSLVHHARPETKPFLPNRSLGMLLLDTGAILLLCGGFLAASRWCVRKG